MDMVQRAFVHGHSGLVELVDHHAAGLLAAVVGDLIDTANAARADI
jgi:hypothetical protein